MYAMEPTGNIFRRVGVVVHVWESVCSHEWKKYITRVLLE